MKSITLIFDRDHTHAGQLIKRGDRRDIPRDSADWLITHDVAHPVAHDTDSLSNEPAADAGESFGIPSAFINEEDDHVH